MRFWLFLRGCVVLTYFAELFVHTTYSMSSVYGLRKAYACVLIQTHSLFFARNRYMTENIWPFCFSTVGERESEEEWL